MKEKFQQNMKSLDITEGFEISTYDKRIERVEEIIRVGFV
jgi:hypothetical protein